MKLIIGILLLGILIPAGNLHAQTADFYLIEAAPLEVSPSEVTTLNVTFRNLGSGTTGYAVYLKSSLDPSDTSPIDPIGPAKIFLGTAKEAAASGEFFGLVKQSDIITLSYDIEVEPGAEEKTHSIPLVLEWKDPNLVTQTQTLNIGIRVKELEADFQVVDFEPKRFEPGDVTDLRLKIKNIGDTFAKKLKISIDPSDVAPIDPIGVLEIQKEIVQPGEIIEISYPIFVNLDATENVYYTPITLSWETYESKSQNLSIGTYIRGSITLGIASVATDPEELRSGTDDVKLTVTVKNSGGADASDAKMAIQFNAPFKPSYSQSDAAYIGSIGTDGTQTATFYFDLEEVAEEGKYAIPLTLKYRDEKDVEYEFSSSVDLIIEPKPYFEIVEVKVEPENPQPQDTVLLSTIVRNIGGEKGESVDLRVIRESDQPFTYNTKSDFIGTLNPGESGTAVIEFEVDEDGAVKDYILKLSIRATGDSEKGDTNVYTQELKATINVGEGIADEQSSTPILGIGILVLILIVSRVLKKKRGAEVELKEESE